MAFNLDIDYKQKRWLLLLALAFFSLSLFPVTRAIVGGWGDIVVFGLVKVSTIASLVGGYLIWEVYKKRT